MSIITDKVNEILYERRNNAEKIAEKNIETALKNIHFKNAFDRSSSLEKDIAYAIYNHENNKLSQLEKEKKALLNERELGLKETGFNESDLLPQYVCDLCKDSGELNNKYCNCKRKLLQEETLNALKLPKRDFRSFKDDNSNTKDEALYQKVLLMKTYVSKFPNVKYKNFLFTGKTGNGKTFLAEMICDGLSKKGFNTLFLSSYNLNDFFFKYCSFDEDRLIYSEAINDCDFLVIDDLGSETVLKKITVENLLSLINRRNEFGKHTLVTTNLTQAEILDKYGDRLFSRLFDKNITKILAFTGKDLRK